MVEEMVLGFEPDRIWPLLCPVREYDWIEMWNCELIHAQSGFNELDCVFRTRFPSEKEPEVWVTSRFEPCSRLEFVRVNTLRSIRYVITLEPMKDGTRLLWSQVLTGLSVQGNRFVAGVSDKEYARRMGMLRAMLDHYLRTGTMLK